MKKSVRIILPVILLIFLVSACKLSHQTITEESFLGEWYAIKGNVEAYSLLKDEGSYIFTGTQGMRPVVYGTWKIDQDKFIIVMDNGTATGYSFTLLNDTLTLNGGAEIYTRTAPIEVKFPEVRILTNIRSDFSNLAFSYPSPSEIKWRVSVDSLQSYNEFAIKGFSISAGTTLSSSSISDLSDYIKDYGFEPDTAYFTEICNGYLDSDQVVTICTSQDTDAKNDSVNIYISSGIIPK